MTYIIMTMTLIFFMVNRLSQVIYSSIFQIWNAEIDITINLAPTSLVKMIMLNCVWPWISGATVKATWFILQFF